MRIIVESFWLSKGGNHDSEYEDAFFPPLTSGWQEDGKQFRFAVADGASSGILSGQWARVLTEVACDLDVPIDNPLVILKTGIARWNGWLDNYLQNRKEHDKPIKWYEEPGLKAGAFSTLLVLEINDKQTNEWRAVAIGDSCLFQVRGGQLVIPFPVEQSNAFNNNPALMCSVLDHNDNLRNEITQSKGEWQIEDEFFLMTDAIAQWFLTQYEMGQQPWSAFQDSSTADDSQSFKNWIDSLREQKTMRNDDVTLVRITLA
jgi:hypothetical protein